MNPGPRQQELARLRTFCLLNAVLYLLVAALAAFLRVLIDETVVAPLLAHEIGCAVMLVVLAASLVWVRGVIARDPAGAARAGRRVGTIALAVLGLCIVGAVIVFLLPSSASGDKLPTVAVSVLTVVFALNTYAGMSKLRRS